MRDLLPARRARAERLGADVVVDPADHSPYERWTGLAAAPLPSSPLLAAAVGPRPPALVGFECVGVPGLLQQVIDGAPLHSQIVVVGVCTQPDTIQPAVAITKELSLDFVFAYRPPPHPDDDVKVLVTPGGPTVLCTEDVVGNVIPSTQKREGGQPLTAPDANPLTIWRSTMT